MTNEQRYATAHGAMDGLLSQGLITWEHFKEGTHNTCVIRLKWFAMRIRLATIEWDD